MTVGRFDCHVEYGVEGEHIAISACDGRQRGHVMTVGRFDCDIEYGVKAKHIAISTCDE